MKHKMLSISVLLLLVLGCGGNTEPRKFEVHGYFKASNKARVFTVSYAPNASETEIKAYGSEKMHTLGAITVTYFYPVDTPNIPNDAVSLAGNVARAMEINGKDGRFTFQGWINPQGKYIFTKVNE